MQQTRGKPGRRRKGARHPITVRVPVECWEVIQQRADEQGYSSASDYLATVLSVHHGFPPPGYVEWSRRAVMEPLPSGEEDADQGAIFQRAG